MNPASIALHFLAEIPLLHCGVFMIFLKLSFFRIKMDFDDLNHKQQVTPAMF